MSRIIAIEQADEVTDIFSRAKQWKKYTIENNFAGEHVDGKQVIHELKRAGEDGELSVSTAATGNPCAAVDVADAIYCTELSPEETELATNKPQ